jgi:hypothetical protein
VEENSVVLLRTDRGTRVRYGPFSPEGVETAIMQFGSATRITLTVFRNSPGRPTSRD